MTDKLPTFSQAQGLEPLPQPLNLNELSKKFRARLWTTIFESMCGSKIDFTGQRSNRGIYIGYHWKRVLLDVYLEFFDVPPDEFSDRFSSNQYIV